jgi:hypothetical protein
MKAHAFRKCLMTVALLASSIVAVGQDTLLYDVTFGTPPHTVGQAPMVGWGAPPRDKPTAIVFGDPRVVAQVGALTDQPCRFGNGTSGYDQLEFAVDWTYPAYHLETTVLIQQLGGPAYNSFTILLDLPTVHTIHFHPDGSIRVWSSINGSAMVGTFAFGQPMSVAVDLDVTAQHWTIWLDGAQVFSGPATVGWFDSVRVNLDGYNATDSAALDDFRLYSGIPAWGWSDDFDDGDISDWTVENPAPGNNPVTIELSDEQYQSASLSLKTDGPNEDYFGGSATGPEVLLAPNQPYVIRLSFRYTDFHWYYLVVFGPVKLILDYPYLPLQYENESGYHDVGSDDVGTYCPPDTWTQFEIRVDPAAQSYEVRVDGISRGTASYDDYDTGFRGFHICESGGDAPAEADYVQAAYYDDLSIAYESFEPLLTALSTFSEGTEDWAVEVGCLMWWNQTDGVPPGALNTSDNDAYSGAQIRAPQKFLGDWSGLNGAGILRFELRYYDLDGYTINSLPWVQLSGPGGTAEVTFDLEVQPHWCPYEVPIDAAAWTVTAGTWAELLANVTKVLVSMDFTWGQDSHGLDNFYVGPGEVTDCNGNGVPDAVDIVEGTSADCNGNGVPDECDIAGAYSPDANGNGIPDECETVTLTGDLNCDEAVNAFDIDPFVLCLVNGTPTAPCTDCLNGDIDQDGSVNAFDIDPFVRCIIHGGCP